MAIPARYHRVVLWNVSFITIFVLAVKKFKAGLLQVVMSQGMMQGDLLRQSLGCYGLLRMNATKVAINYRF